MILSESELSQRAANETLPLRDAFAVLFFVSVGMLFDPSILITNPLPVLATVFIIVIGKSLAAFGIVLLFRRPVGTALTISASLAQIGEFSFILASMGVALSIMPPEGQDLILAGALISIVLNPLVFWAIEALRPRLETRYGLRVEAAGGRVEPGEFSRAAEGPATTDAPTQAAVDRGPVGADGDTGKPSEKTGHTVLVGYGQVGRIVADGLQNEGLGVVVIEDSDHDVAAARAAGFEVVYGNAAAEHVLKLANLGAAQNLLIAISNAFEAGAVCETGRKLSPSIAIVTRAYSEEEEDFLRGLGASVVIRGEREIGKGILEHLRLVEATKPVSEPEDIEEPKEPKLPVSDNILARAAGVAAPTAVVFDGSYQVIENKNEIQFDAGELSASDEIPVIEAVVDQSVAESEGAAEPVNEPTLPPAEVIVISPETAGAEDKASETLSVGEAPAAIDEIVVVTEMAKTELVLETDPGSIAGDETPEDKLRVETENQGDTADKTDVPPVIPEPKV